MQIKNLTFVHRYANTQNDFCKVGKASQVQAVKMPLKTVTKFFQDCKSSKMHNIQKNVRFLRVMVIKLDFLLCWKGRKRKPLSPENYLE